MTTREEKETLEVLRRVDERLLVVVELLEVIIELNRPATYKAPIGFGFKAR